MRSVEPTDALRSIETALRLVIRDVLGDEGWLAAAGSPDRAPLEQKRTEENKRRDGAAVSSNLLDYTETYQLTNLVLKNWESFKPVFSDKARTESFFGVVADVRNSVAHSRDLVPFERDLISGVAGQLRNQVSLFRSSVNQSSKYYPLIESVKDQFGLEGFRGGNPYDRPLPIRLEVDDVITFTGSAFNARGKPVKWKVAHPARYPRDTADVAEGDSVSFQYTVTEADVEEYFRLSVQITTDSRYHRISGGDGVYDDQREFIYSVNQKKTDSRPLGRTSQGALRAFWSPCADSPVTGDFAFTAFTATIGR
jgi:hypothetical protein